MKFESVVYTVADSFLSSLMYGDNTGLDNAEIKALDQFEQDVIADYGVGHWSLVNDYADFDIDRITGLGANCVQIEYVYRV